MDDLTINDHLTIHASMLTWKAARASGPGGQHVNRTSSKVELLCDPIAAGVPRGAVRRLRVARPGLFDSEGVLHIESQDSRSQRQNLDHCRRRLAQLLREHWHAPRPRKKTKPTRSSIRRRLDGKKRRSERKQGRKKISRDD
jgi:ribosome-associated protein